MFLCPPIACRHTATSRLQEVGYISATCRRRKLFCPCNSEADHAFLFSTSRIALFLRAKSAYIRLSFAYRLPGPSSASTPRHSPRHTSPVEVGPTANPVLPGQLAQRDAGFAFFQ